MHLLSFEKALRRRVVPLDDALLTTALEMLWRAYCYATDSNADVWEFAVEIDEFHRAQISNSELRWLLNQGYVAHAQETASEQGSRKFRRSPGTSLSNASCFVIADEGVALVKSSDIAAPTKKCAGPRTSTLSIESERHWLVDAKPSWDAQRRELWIDGRLVKQLRRPSSNQQTILDAFEAAHWPRRIVNPLPLRSAQCPKRRLHDAIKCLNRNHSQEAIRFSGDGSGHGVLWEFSG